MASALHRMIVLAVDHPEHVSRVTAREVDPLVPGLRMTGLAAAHPANGLHQMIAHAAARPVRGVRRQTARVRLADPAVMAVPAVMVVRVCAVLPVTGRVRLAGLDVVTPARAVHPVTVVARPVIRDVVTPYPARAVHPEAARVRRVERVVKVGQIATHLDRQAVVTRARPVDKMQVLTGQTARLQ